MAAPPFLGLPLFSSWPQMVPWIFFVCLYLCLTDIDICVFIEGQTSDVDQVLLDLRLINHVTSGHLCLGSGANSVDTAQLIFY